MGRTHFCSFSVSHKPTQSSPRHQMSGTLPSVLISHHDSTANKLAAMLKTAVLPSAYPSLAFYSFPCQSTDVHAARAWGGHSISCNLGHFTAHECSHLHKRREQYGSENEELWTKEGLLQLLNALRQLQVQLQF